MKRRTLVMLAVLAAVALAVRTFLHSTAPPAPALVTPGMNVHRLVSKSLGARVDRLVHGRVPASRRGYPRLIALTFDDGPYAVATPLLLDELRDLRLTATFFLIGRDVEEQPELTRRIVAEHHELADHTLTDANLDALGEAATARELIGGTRALAPFTRARSISTEMRPPHGRFTETTLRVAQRLGYDTVLWTDDPGDWRNIPASTLADHVLRNATAPELLLLHSGRLATIEMLETVVPRFLAAGYRFVTVSELLARVTPAMLNHPQKVDLSLR